MYEKIDRFTLSLAHIKVNTAGPRRV